MKRTEFPLDGSSQMLPRQFPHVDSMCKSSLPSKGCWGGARTCAEDAHLVSGQRRGIQQLPHCSRDAPPVISLPPRLHEGRPSHPLQASVLDHPASLVPQPLHAQATSLIRSSALRRGCCQERHTRQDGRGWPRAPSKTRRAPLVASATPRCVCLRDTTSATSACSPPHNSTLVNGADTTT